MWTKDRIARAVQLKTDGLSLRQIARALGGLAHLRDEGRHAVAGAIWRAKRTRPSQRGRALGSGRKVDPEEVLAAAIVLDGGTIDEAMEETGLSREHVGRAVINAKNREWRDRRKLREAEARSCS